MSLTVFFALCIISIDFMIYFFFKLLYGEKKKRVVRRRLPTEYYDESFSRSRSGKSSPLYEIPAHNNRPAAKKSLSMPAPKPELPTTGARKERQEATPPRRNFPDLLAHRRIVLLCARARTRP